MGAVLSGRYIHDESYEEYRQQQQQRDNELGNGNNSNAPDGGGGRNEFAMSPLSSILPQFYTTKTIKSRVNIHKDTIVMVRVDKDNNSYGNTGTIASLNDNYPIITIQSSNNNNEMSSNHGDGDNDTTSTTTTTTTTTTNNNVNNNTNNQDIKIDINENIIEDNGAVKLDKVVVESPPPIIIDKGLYNLTFAFDSEDSCVIEVYIVAKDIQNKLTSKLKYGPYQYHSGLSQTFSLPPTDYIDVSDLNTKDLTVCNLDISQYPVIISIKSNSDNQDSVNLEKDISIPTSSTITTTTANTSTNSMGSNYNSNSNLLSSYYNPSSTDKQPLSLSSSNVDFSKEQVIKTQYTYLALIACNDYTYAIKPLKQKTMLGQQSFILHDIYGLEGSGSSESKECVICLSEPKDTLAIPCRHFSLCSSCADKMRTVSIKCPICRSPIRYLVKIVGSHDG